MARKKGSSSQKRKKVFHRHHLPDWKRTFKKGKRSKSTIKACGRGRKEMTLVRGRQPGGKNRAMMEKKVCYFKMRGARLPRQEGEQNL